MMLRESLSKVGHFITSPNGQVFKQTWKHAAPGDQHDAPRALKSEYTLRQVLVAAAVQGAIFAVVKALMSRGGARAFQRWTGEWPGD